MKINCNPIAALLVGMMGYKLNGDSIVWGVVDALFYPIIVIKWIVCEELTFSLIRTTFPFFFN